MEKSMSNTRHRHSAGEQLDAREKEDEAWQGLARHTRGQKCVGRIPKQRVRHGTATVPLWAVSW